MSGTLKIGGKTLATHNSNTNIAKLQLGSANDVVLADSAGNSVLSESGGVVTLENVTFPAGHVIKTEMTSRISGSTTDSSDQSIATPSFTTTVTNSKVYIMMTLLCRTKSPSSNNYIYVKFFHGTTILLDGFPIVGSINATDVRGVAAWNYLYSPNVAANTVLNFDVKINAAYAGDTVYVDSSTNPSHITFMEIAP